MARPEHVDLILNGNTYSVLPTDFPIQPHAEYFNLKIYPDVGRCERIVGLLVDMIDDIYPGSTVGVIGWRRGGFVPINCRRRGVAVQVYPGAGQTLEDVPAEFRPAPALRRRAPSVVFIEEGDETADEPVRLALSSKPLVVAVDVPATLKPTQRLRLADTPFSAWLQPHHIPLFRTAFHYYMDETAKAGGDGILAYDNLIHLVIMVKNAGAGFEQVLRNNLPVIDRWTVLDTGSTDGTQDVVRKVLGGVKKGALYEEPFINFRESRNRSLELAGTRCKFALILDDTYWVDGPLRSFLNLVRGDQFATSYSGMILSGDSEYYSNRIIKTEAGLRYMYTIHEVIQDEGNTNVVIPKDQCRLVDECSPFMEGRTKGRKARDIELLEGMLEEDPDNPRHLYYLAQTYKCLENWEKTAEYFEKRIAFPKEGFLQEKVDACFELARLYNFTLKKPWPVCKALYEKSFELEPRRPDALYFIGIHYQMEGDATTAFRYFKQAIGIGYPIHTQYSLKPTLYYHFLPKFLVPLCYQFEEFALGEATAKLFLENNKPTEDSYELVANWRSIFQHLLKAEAELAAAPSQALRGDKPLLVLLADGGFAPWTGRDILTKGVGGSETYIIEMARHIQAAGVWQVAVLCNCGQPDLFEDVHYVPLEQTYSFLARHTVKACVVSRFSEYVPACMRLPSVESVFLVLHDLGPSGSIIPVHEKLRGIFCLTEWHKGYFLERFPQFADRTHAFGYGINRELIERLRGEAAPPQKVPHRFIYSSFPNRGLLPLLRMWPRIQARWPDATLHVYTDLSNAWVNRVAPDTVADIRAKLAELAAAGAAVTVKGWVDKATLTRAWLEADVWFYPCTFQETYCLTAMEAAATRTLAVTNDLAALQNTVGRRGVMIPGDATDRTWQQRALETLFSAVDNALVKETLLRDNEAWAASQSWSARAAEFQKKFLQPLEAAAPPSKAPAKQAHKNVRPELNYADMYNWTNDLPDNTRHLFEAALRSATEGKVAPKLLEIGTYAGTSTVEMLKLVPAATAVTVDRWEDYDEFGNPVLGEIGARKIMNIYHENMDAGGVAHRVRALRGDSSEKLIELLREGYQFDFIYVDGGHKCLDCYADMVLSWPLLKRGGILAVDDVLFKAEKKDTDPLAVPYAGVEYFVQKYKGQYEIVHSGYRLYLKKLSA
jgi:predicted O-methyltransferase YrrM/tetratricopeptide (TPR) repeat protein